MKVEMVMPQMGESIAEGTVLKWVKKVGDLVKKDENILEISTDKVDSEIPSPAAGRLVELRAKEGETVPVGQVIAILETDVTAGADAPAVPAGAPAAAPGAAAPAAAAAAAAAPAAAPAAPAAPAQTEAAPYAAAMPASTPAATMTPPAPQPEAQPVGQVGVGAGAAAPLSGATIPREHNGKFFSPLVRSIARSEGIGVDELAAIAGSGREGRVTRDDLLGHLSARKGFTVAVVGGPGGSPAAGAAAASMSMPSAPSAARSAPMPTAPVAATATGHSKKPAPLGFDVYPKFTPSESKQTGDGRIDVVPMDNMRQKIAEHMVRSKATSPHVASVTEVDMTRIVRHREAWKGEFQAKYGFSLSYTAYIIQAAVQGLLDYPMMNSSVDGTNVLVKRYIHFGVAVALESGLIVPVIKHAEDKNFLGLARSLNDLATRARSKQLKPDDVSGGTFTLTNMGSFGNLFGIPIISQPQVGILGVGAIVKRPWVVDDMIAIRDIMYLSLSYDHRIVDGALGGLFIQRVRQYLESGELVGSF